MALHKDLYATVHNSLISNSYQWATIQLCNQVNGKTNCSISIQWKFQLVIWTINIYYNIYESQNFLRERS